MTHLCFSAQLAPVIHSTVVQPQRALASSNIICLVHEEFSLMHGFSLIHEELSSITYYCSIFKSPAVARSSVVQVSGLEGFETFLYITIVLYNLLMGKFKCRAWYVSGGG